MAVLQADTQDVQISVVDIEPYIAWNSGRFVFDNCSLESLMNVISRWYNKDVVFESEDTKKIRFTGDIDRYGSIEPILKSDTAGDSSGNGNTGEDHNYKEINILTTIKKGGRHAKKRARERIIMFLCIISLLFTPVLAASQSNAMRVSLDLKSATVKEFFDAVKVQTGLNFIYSTEQVKNMPRITIQSNSQPISEVLNKVLANTGYSYEIEGNIVTIVYQQPKENVRTATGVVVDEEGCCRELI